MGYPEQDKNRFYYLAWQPCVVCAWAVVRSCGCKDGQQRTLTSHPYPLLTDAWPLLRVILRRRLHHGYKIVEPKDLAETGFSPAC